MTIDNKLRRDYPNINFFAVRNWIFQRIWKKTTKLYKDNTARRLSHLWNLYSDYVSQYPRRYSRVARVFRLVEIDKNDKKTKKKDTFLWKI